MLMTTAALHADDSPKPDTAKTGKPNPVQHILSKFDKNGDGILQPDEVAAMVAARNKRMADKGDGKTTPPKLTADDLMKKFDANGDGNLDAKELQAMAKELHAHHRGAHKKPTAPSAAT
jgi:Ca2+-binding EF-hand superfamily protein